MRSPPLAPLRTGRASFPASGSSLYERPSRDAAGSPRTAFTIRAWSRRTLRQTFLQLMECQPGTRSGTAPAGVAAADISALLPWSVGQDSLVMKDPREVSRLSPWGDVAFWLNPYPVHYRPAFACSLIPYPPSHRRALRYAFRGRCRPRETTGLPRSAAVPVWVRSRLSAGGPTTAPEEFGDSGPGHVPFGPSVSASCAWLK